MTHTTPRNIDFKRELNDEQYRAATAPDGPMLVLAAAGTGKTRTLVYRVAYLVSRGIAPHNILLLTFTNRAAREMLERARELVGESVAGVWGGTFHHMANRILRRHADKIGYPHDYTIFDRDDSRTLVTQCVKELNLKHREFPKRDVLISLFGTAANTQRAVDELAEERFDTRVVDVDDVKRVHTLYERRKRELKAMDFDDLLTNALLLLRSHEGVRVGYQERFRHVLVDEYQDTNAIQAQFVELLAERHGNLLVVGDDFQSIYSWRGADYRNIMSFPETHPDAQVFKLETNYRSVPEILSVANACIAGNPEQFQKVLRPTRPPAAKPRVVRLRDGRNQAEFVGDLVRALLREGHEPGQIAVLYRAHFHAMELQMELTQSNIPYVITSGVRFFEQAHIKDVCALLRLLENPGDEMAFTRLLGLLPGVGPRTALKIWTKLGGAFVTRSPEARALVLNTLKGDAREIWNDVDAILEHYHAGDACGAPDDTMQDFVKAYYERYAQEAFDNADQRLDDIRELILHAATYDSTATLLSDVALLTNIDKEADSAAALRDCIHLSTVHQAKGLEWSTVILIWVNEGLFPASRSLDDDSVDGDSEERRLFYVAVTRAKDNLILCVPELRRMRDGGVYYTAPSRFIDEVPRNLLRTEYGG